MNRARQFVFGFIVFIVFGPPSFAGTPKEEGPTVGVTARFEQIVLPGSELEAKPFDRQSPIVVRVLSVYPHGSDLRYDFEYYGLEPGEYDLKDYLQRKDGSDLSTLPQILVTIRSLLPKGQIEPHALVQSPAPWIGGYQLILIGFGIVWLGGLFAILFVGRKKHAASALAMRGPLTLSDRLRPMVEDAIAGRLSIGKQAELERLLLAFWRRRLGLENMKPGQALAVLREHDEAGLLLRQLERWLHAPKQAPNADVDATIKALLEPYARDSAVDWVSEPTSSGVGWVSDPTFSERKEPRSESQATSRTGDPTYGEGH